MKSSILAFNLLILSLLAMIEGEAFGANASPLQAPTHPVDGNYITDWLVIGPFFPNDLKTDFLATAGGEANIQPKAGDKVATKDGKTLTWKRYQSKGNIIDLIDAIGKHEYATAYAFCVLQSQVSDTAEIFLGSDDGMAVWINGKQAHINPVYRPLDSDVFDVNLKAGDNRCLLKVTQKTENWALSMRIEMLPPNRAYIKGVISDKSGKPIPNAEVRLEQNNIQIAQVRTDISGGYQIRVFPVHGSYDLSATSGELGAWQLGIKLSKGESRTVNLTLREAVSISGTLQAFDNSPHAAVPVQAIGGRRAKGEGRNLKNEKEEGEDEQVIATALSDESGKYQFINLKPGRYYLRCYTGVGDGYVYYSRRKAEGGMKKKKKKAQKTPPSALRPPPS